MAVSYIPIFRADGSVALIEAAIFTDEFGPGLNGVREGSFIGSASDPSLIAEVTGVDPDPTALALVIREALTGCLNYHRVATADTNAARIKSGAGIVFEVSLFNNSNLVDAQHIGYPLYLKLHDSNDNPPVAGTTPVLRSVPVQSGLTSEIVFPKGLKLENGLGITLVRGILDTDSTPVAAEDCDINIAYR